MQSIAHQKGNPPKPIQAIYECPFSPRWAPDEVAKRIRYVLTKCYALPLLTACARAFLIEKKIKESFANEAKNE